MKIWLLLSRFENGGLERVQANLAPSFVQSGIDTSLVAGNFLTEAKPMLPDRIPTLELSSSGKLSFIFNLYRQLQIHQPDVIMTTSNDVSCLVLILRALFFPNIKVICTQHLSVSAPLQHAKGLQKLKYFIILKAMQHLWPKADAIIAVSSALAKEVRYTLKLERLINTIHNPIVLPGYSSLIKQPINWPWSDKKIPTLIFVGRLARVKRIDLLLNAFKKVQKEHFCRLLILGEGSERNNILNFISKNNLGSLIYLAGQQNNPLPWIKAADILVLPSDYEGFGNVLVEAMACGTQVIATHCPFGPAEILDHGRYGQLVPTNNSDALAQAMTKAIEKTFYVSANELRNRANEFNLESSIHKYLNVIYSLRAT